MTIQLSLTQGVHWRIEGIPLHHQLHGENAFAPWQEEFRGLLILQPGVSLINHDVNFPAGDHTSHGPQSAHQARQ